MEKAKVAFEVKIVRKLPVAQKYSRQISRKKYILRIPKVFFG